MRQVAPAISKSSQIRSAWATGDRIGALHIAARFFDRSLDTLIFKRGMNAYTYPDFYRQLGHDPEQITAEALQLLAAKFGLDEHDAFDIAKVPLKSACREL
jgi:hypothetical protein